MSAELLARKAVAALKELRDQKVSGLRKCKPRSPTVLPEGQGTIPASTCEEISLYAVDLNATIDALNVAIETIEKEFEKLTKPEEPPEEPPTDTTQARRLYG